MRLKRALRFPNIKGTLIRNYASMFMIVILSFGSSMSVFAALVADPFQLWGEQWSSGKDSDLVLFIKQKAGSELSAANLAESDIPELHASDILEYGGWIEVLDEKGSIVRVVGEKKTEAISYTNSQLYGLLANQEDAHWHTSIAPIKSERKREASLLVLLPRSAVVHHLAPAEPSSNPLQVIIISLLAAIALFFIMVAGLIYLLGKWTARRLTQPVYSILEGIRHMARGRYNARLEFEAEIEFMQIRDAFNFMVSQLEKAKLEKKELEASKRRMIMDLSHDLRTPITTIQGYARALEEGLIMEEEKKKRYLKVIQEKSVRVTELVDKISELASLERPGFELVKREEDLCEFIRQFIAEHYDEIENNRFELELVLPERVVQLLLDRSQLTRVLSNLFQNTIKYNPPGTKLTVQLSAYDDHVEILFADTGVGIGDSLKKAVFEPFVRGDRIRKTTGGLGLGLAISKAIVEKHGGKLELAAMPGKKTVFKITLPKS